MRVNRWGTVCRNQWDQDDAIVACRQLSIPGLLKAVTIMIILDLPLLIILCTLYYNIVANNVIAIPNFGGGVGPIFLDNLGCIGTENSLFDCPHNRIHDCTHAQDAGVVCDSMFIIINVTFTMPCLVLFFA